MLDKHGNYRGKQLDNAVSVSVLSEVSTFCERTKKNEEASDVRHSLQHLFRGVTAHIIGHRVSPVQGCFHVQAADEVFRAFLVEVKCHLSHVCP